MIGPQCSYLLRTIESVLDAVVLFGVKAGSVSGVPAILTAVAGLRFFVSRERIRIAQAQLRFLTFSGRLDLNFEGKLCGRRQALGNHQTSYRRDVCHDLRDMVRRIELTPGAGVPRSILTESRP